MTISKLGHTEGAHMDEATFLREYKARDYPRPSVTVDLVVFTVIDADLKVLLIKRGGHPFQGCWALPGGFVDVKEDPQDQGEDLDDAAYRELAEETGLPPGSLYLEQLYTFGKAGRDPRTRVIDVAYYSLIPPDKATRVHAGDDAREAGWFSVEHEAPNMELAFDHVEVLAMGVARIRGKLNYTDIAFELVPPTFTASELRVVHEAVQGHTYDGSNFRRRFHRMQTDGILEKAPGKRASGAGRPAAVYRFTRNR